MRVRIRVLIACVAMLAVGAALASGWAGVLQDWHGSTAERLGQLPPAADPKCASEAPCMRFYVVGDTGWQNEDKVSVITSMVEKARVDPPGFVLMLGDNFYRSGVTSVRDEQWLTHFERSFAAPELAVPFRPVLGNHDHKGNVQAQVEYSSVNPRWRMDGHYYAFTERVSPNWQVDFFMLDTNPIQAKDDAAKPQIRWLEDKLANSTARWKIVAGHHPIVSGGHNGSAENLRDAIEPLLQKYGVDIYMAGHDHDLQLLHVPNSTCLQLVSGAGCSTREVRWIDETLYAEASPGFAWLLVGPSELWVQFVTSRSGPRFTHLVRKSTG